MKLNVHACLNLCLLLCIKITILHIFVCNIYISSNNYYVVHCECTIIVAAKVMERERHTIKGQDLHLQYKITHVSKVQERMVELNKLLLCNIPEDLEVDTDYLNLFVSNQLEMDDEEFSVQLDGDTAMVEFGIEYTCEGKNWST